MALLCESLHVHALTLRHIHTQYGKMCKPERDEEVA